MDLIEIVSQCLGIPKKYMILVNAHRNNIVVALVHKTWLQQLSTKYDLSNFICHDTLTEDEVQAYLYQERFSSPWQKILIRIYSRLNNEEAAIPLPRPRVTENAQTDSCLSYAQLLHFISETNYRNLWKYCYKKYNGSILQGTKKESRSVNFSSCKEIVREVIRRLYGCPIILLSNTVNLNHNIISPRKETEFEPHSNVLPALCAIEHETNMFTLHSVDYIKTLQDCVTFNPAILNTNYAKCLFIIYQLLNVMKDSHDRGINIGNIVLDDIFIVNDALFIQIIPPITDNVYVVKTGCEYKIQNTKRTRDHETLSQFKYKRHRDAVIYNMKTVEDLATTSRNWVKGFVTNFDYLMYLNHMVGRRFGDPTCHFVMPWITDFATKSNGVWRDLTKSKFRLNKGDKQLDLTYEDVSGSSSNQVGHHVTDILSDITYYVYMSRRTPRSVLCKYVRTTWVPAEYPSSIQRLQSWTPDECIPEFFYDPSIFKSIHEDLPDLELPPWATTPEQFIESHREALECRHVSERLHHWIDLTFGFKLSGTASVKSKNVCLQLVDSHKTLNVSGVVQLFKHPHPNRLVTSPFFDKVPPKQLFYNSQKKSRHQNNVHSERSPSVTTGTAGSDDEVHSSGNEDDTFGAKISTLGLGKFMNRSRGSLLAPFHQSSSTSDEQANTIHLPREYNPTALLTSVENTYNFVSKTFQHTRQQLDVAENQEQSVKQSLKQVVASARIKEMQILGCLVVELFLASKLRALNRNSDVGKRIAACRSFLKHNRLPHCVRNTVAMLLQLDVELVDVQNDLNTRGASYTSYPSISTTGLPPPSAHQLLQPLLSTYAFPFPKLMRSFYACVSGFNFGARILKSYGSSDVCATACDLNYLNEVRGSRLCDEMISIIDQIGDNFELMEMVYPFVKEVFHDPDVNKKAVFRLFHKFSVCLGVRRTNEWLLDAILDLFYQNSWSSKCPLLFHQSFLHVLIHGFGLKSFLDNFVAPVVETVGKCQECFSPGEDLIRSHSRDLTNGDAGEVNNSLYDDDSSPELERKVQEDRTCRDVTGVDVEGVFEFERDQVTCHVNTAPNEFDEQSEPDDDETSVTSASRVKSPVIDVPVQNKFKFKSIECEVGSKSNDSLSRQGSSKSIDSAKTSTIVNDVVNSSTCTVDTLVKSDDDWANKKSSETARESITWLSTRLGPVLTARYITKNLLRMLSLCYQGAENLARVKLTKTDLNTMWRLSVTEVKVAGDDNAELVLESLASITQLYGEQFILVQYFPYMTELIKLCRRKLTLSFESGVIGCLALLKFIIPYLNDSVLMDQLQDVILKNILHPVVRLVSSTRLTFPSGHSSRWTLVTKFVDTLYVIALRIGSEMSKIHLSVPSLQRFFLAFDKAYSTVSNCSVGSLDERADENVVRSLDDRYVEIQRDGSAIEWSVRGTGLPGLPLTFSHVRSNESIESFSPPVEPDNKEHEGLRSKTLAELKSVFTPELAYVSYLPFLKFLGVAAMENTVKNQQLIKDLCYEFEQVRCVDLDKGESNQISLSDFLTPSGDIAATERGGAGSFGSNVAVIGNKIELNRVDVSCVSDVSDDSVTSLVSNKFTSSNRHLRGNWLAYWEHEVGRSEKDTRFNFKQIKLQTFTGHTNSVRGVYCLDSENSFISGSRDKTVKLWSLRSQGDGSAVTNCQYTYTRHKKSLLSLVFVTSRHAVVSCDSTVHVWDPYTGKTIATLDNAKYTPVNIVKLIQSSSFNLVASTTDSTLKILDTRSLGYVSEYKVSWNPTGVIRSMCVSPSGNWIAVGQASGQVSVLDTRTGTLMSTWKEHEGEVLQLAAANDQTLVSSSLDQTITVWNVTDSRHKYHMKGHTEPVHCLCTHNKQLLTGTTANRIGVHTSLDENSSFSSVKLRSETVKGVLTCMSVLPLNNLFILGTDTGNITLLC